LQVLAKLTQDLVSVGIQEGDVRLLRSVVVYGALLKREGSQGLVIVIAL
jgi:hypothetical protein